MRDEMKVSLDSKGSVSIIHLTGEITTFSEEKILEVYQLALNRNAKKILLDFCNVNYINSAGIAILIGLVTSSKKNNINLYISGLTPHFKKIFKMVGLTQYTKIFDDKDSALNQLNQ
ncbi:MAG: hypothetical protein B6244_01570 [Candidatus Cloacimonetes bacterium 4572_55]|nr:MAG: hypothetical protein B6244_01570 [Candidatus Cloacimonetes bacterium 4572_55]